MRSPRLTNDFKRAALAVSLLTAVAAAQETTRVSVASRVEANGHSFSPSISADGKIVAFESSASNLVAGDTNGFVDVFFLDRSTGITERVSVDARGTEGDSDSYSPSISRDGRSVAFVSAASNLVAGDTNGQVDVFVYDRSTRSTERVSVDSDSLEANLDSYSPSISADGQIVAFLSNASNLVGGDFNSLIDVFVRDRSTRNTERVSVDSSDAEANDISFGPSISADGQIVAFGSYASNLVGHDRNGDSDVFVHDRRTGSTERVSVDSAGVEGDFASSAFASPSISSDGQIVAFQSYATNLVAGDTNNGDVFVHERSTGKTERVSVGFAGAEGDGDSFAPSISADGQVVAFQSDASNLVGDDVGLSRDVFVHVRSTGSTERVSEDSSGAGGNGNSEEPSISANGQIVAFFSNASNLVGGDTNNFVDIFVHDRRTGNTERVSVDPAGAEGNSDSGAFNGHDTAISADGQIVAFSSFASNLFAYDPYNHEDIFVHDRSTGITESTSFGGDGQSFSPSISADGQFVAFTSSSTNFGVDTNHSDDVFVWNRSTGVLERVSVSSSGAQAFYGGSGPSISADGQIVAFESFSPDLVAGDTEETTIDIYVHDRSTGITERVSVDSSGAEANSYSDNASISADGQVVAFVSYASNLVAGDTGDFADIFVHDRSTGITERVNVDSSGAEANFPSISVSISADGQIVAFTSEASNLVAGDTNGAYDVFVHDRSTGITERVSVDSSGAQGDNSSSSPSISADGRFVAFSSASSNLGGGKATNFRDIFVHDRKTGITERVNVDSSGAEANDDSQSAAISADGEIVVFSSWASNLVAGDTNNSFDVFVHDRCSDPDATWSNYGTGFPGKNGVPSFTSRSDPVLGTTLTLDLANSGVHDSIALVLVGYSEARNPSRKGGDVLVVIDFCVLLPLPDRGLTIPYDIPDDGALCGLEIFIQALEIDPGAAKGVSFTAGLKLVHGH